MCAASASFSSPRHDGLDGNFIVHPVSDLDEQGNAEAPTSNTLARSAFTQSSALPQPDYLLFAVLRRLGSRLRKVSGVRNYPMLHFAGFGDQQRNAVGIAVMRGAAPRAHHAVSPRHWRIRRKSCIGL